MINNRFKTFSFSIALLGNRNHHQNSITQKTTCSDQLNYTKKLVIFFKKNIFLLNTGNETHTLISEQESVRAFIQCVQNVLVLDPFCGAVDIDPNKIKMARHNAEIWGVAGKIYSKLKADVVFMSPPWRGPGYSFIKCYIINDHAPGYFSIFDIIKTIAPNITFHMPKIQIY
ncbi:Uncharacterized protein FWK35_00017663 [Aphis craccivora]|uniref:Trimethylguanosine synthase n=1 Tax=Aphis craccivora TaxID=307492 RepID=A0A6G0VYR6_APHCR|nr:Uncharacterized protein FWK35_00017663 [Aphis craccivora]